MSAGGREGRRHDRLALRLFMRTYPLRLACAGFGALKCGLRECAGAEDIWGCVFLHFFLLFFLVGFADITPRSCPLWKNMWTVR